MQIRVRNAIASFDHIRKPYVPKTGDAKFSICGICDDKTTIRFTRDGENHEVHHTEFMEKVMPLLMEDADIKKKPVTFFNYLYNKASEQVGMRKPKISEKTGGYYEGYDEDTMFFSAGTKADDAPDGIMVVDEKLRPLDASKGKPKAGDRVTILISAYCYSSKDNGTGASGGLEGVQFLAKGKGFGRVAPEPSAFDEEVEDTTEEEEAPI